MKTGLWALSATIYLDSMYLVGNSEPIYVPVAVCTSVDSAKTIAESYSQQPLNWSVDDEENNPLWDSDADTHIELSYGLFHGRISAWCIVSYEFGEQLAYDWSDPVPIQSTE